MDSVVLLVTSLDGDMSGYGSGIVIDDKGIVLTNLHVLDNARAIYALPHDPERPSYAAVDGGLQRLVFEREKDLIPVSVVRGDPVLDLAVVRLNKPARVVVAKLQTKEPAVGDAVFALGHPEQNFWTVTRGQVSGRHQGFLQHDAAVNKGNSGGPLLNAAGEVVGINTSFIKGAPGIYYARQVALAGKLVDVVKAPLVLDRSTPEKAVTSCARARELGDPSYSQCIDWGSHYAFFRDMLLDILHSRPTSLANVVLTGDSALRGGVKTRPRDQLRKWLEQGDGRPDAWLQKYGPMVLAWGISDDPVELGRQLDTFLLYVQDASRGGRSAQEPHVAASRRMKRDELLAVMRANAARKRDAGRPDEGVAFQLRQNTGLKVQTEDVAAFRKTMKMGLRVERTLLVGKDRAWVEVAGRNLDGSPYRFSIQLALDAGGWRERLPRWIDFVEPSLGGDVKLRKAESLMPPPGFPPPVHLSLMPAFMGSFLGNAMLALYAVEDPPVGGISIDFDFEHVWPAALELMRADPDQARRLVTFVSDFAIAAEP